MQWVVLLVVVAFAIGASSSAPPSGCDVTPAPASYIAQFSTSRGSFAVTVTRSWSPLGADRFYNLIQCGFFNTTRFFRVVPNFVVQFGINGDPATDAKWVNATIVDDPVLKSNILGTISFATAGPNTRTTQVFINYANNSFLDSQGFSPFGVVSTGMSTVVQQIYSGYGEQPDQELIYSQGNAYLKQNFPLLDYDTAAWISSSSPIDV